MPKLANLYYLFLQNVFCFFLLGIFLINSSFTKEEIVKKNKDNKIRTIVIDAGHGGKDSGTMGTKRFDIYEKHVALSVSLKLGGYIKTAFPDIEVIYTRKKDVFLDLKKRTQIANNADADLFISIHCDGFTNPQPSGASVFVMGMSKLKANMDVAMRENSAIYLEDNYQQKYDGFDPNSPESYIVFSLMQNTYLNQSLKIAEEVEKQFSTRANRKSRGVKQAPFYVISRTNMPSILIECGFLTNPKEEEYLHSELGQDYIASAIFRAFRSYKEEIDLNVKNFEIENKPNNSIRRTKIKQETSNILASLVYKVQVGTYLKSMKDEKKIKELNLPVEEELINETYKCFIGALNNKESADILRKKLLDKGFKGAFVVAFYKGNKISTKEALDLQQNNNYE